jgi:hypothetical protein
MADVQFWASVNPDDLLDADVDAKFRLQTTAKCSPLKAGESTKLIPCWQAGLFDKDIWEVAADKDGPCTLLHKSTRATYEVSPTRVNKALVALDPEHAAESLIPCKKNCRYAYVVHFSACVL